MFYICTRNEAQLVYGVMVTLLFLVQSFKVRVLVDQRKTSHLWEVFSFIYVFDFQNFVYLERLNIAACKNDKNIL